MNFLTGKKTLIGSLILCLLGVVWSLDLIVNGSPTWLTDDQYYAAGQIVAGLTGAAMRLAIGGVEKQMAPPKQG